MRNLVRKYCLKISPERKVQLEEKVIAESLFKGKKSAYAESVGEWFERYRTKPPGALNGVTMDQISVCCWIAIKCILS